MIEPLAEYESPAALYELSLFGGRPRIEIKLSMSGGPSTIAAGDLDGYFVETPQGFRYIPSEVFKTAVQERIKNGYEVFSQDTEGRS